MLQLLGDREERESAEAKQVRAVETELAKASKGRVELRDPEANYHKMSVADLAETAAGFDWSTYFQSLGISDEQLAKMDVEQPEFFQLGAELAADTPLDGLKTYFRWD